MMPFEVYYSLAGFLCAMYALLWGLWRRWDGASVVAACFWGFILGFALLPAVTVLLAFIAIVWLYCISTNQPFRPWG